MIAAILAQLGRGVSYWQVYGGYTHEARTVVLCTIYRQQLGELKRVVSEVDGSAFVTIGMTQQAMGEGFLDIRRSVG